MAEVAFKLVEEFSGGRLGFWGPLATGDEPVAVVVSQYERKFVQVVGEGSVGVLGSLIPGEKAEFHPLTDKEGYELVHPWGPIREIAEWCFQIKPRVARADGVYVWLALKG